MGEFAWEFADGGVDDADVQVLGQDQHAGSGVGPADADVVQPPGQAQGDGADVVDAVAAHSVVAVGLAAGGAGFGAGGVDGGGVARAGSDGCGRWWLYWSWEPDQQRLQLGEGGGLVRLGAQPRFGELLARLVRAMVKARDACSLAPHLR